MEIKYVEKLNPKNFEMGQIVFFVKDFNKAIDWGVVEEIYGDGYGLALYEPIDDRMIEGIPIDEYNFNQKPRKLPKGWSWDTDLVHMTINPDIAKQKESEPYNYNPSTLQHLIDIGLLVRPNSQWLFSTVEADITKDGYTIIRKSKSSLMDSRERPNYAIVPFHRIYSTAEEAQSIVKKTYEELKRQSELSDYDWSVEQIDKSLNQYAYVKNIDDKEKQAIRDFILSQKNVEDIEVRGISEGFQWKYWKNKRWNTVII